MIRDQFFQDTNGGYAKYANKMIFDQTWSRVKTFEESTGLCLDDGLTKEQYIELFTSMKPRKNSVFKNYKYALLYYVRYLIDNGVLPPEHEAIISSIKIKDTAVIEEGSVVQYYKDIDMLRNAIWDSIRSAMVDDETVYYMPAVILYLAWYGLTEEEILNYEKSDVLDDGIMIHGNKLVIPPDILGIFTRFRDADGYYQLAKNEIFHKYAYSNYLIRTERTDHLNHVQFRCALYRFNHICDNVYSLTYSVVFQSGIFNRVYRMECDGFKLDLTDGATASRVFCDDLSDGTRRNNKIREYEFYKSLFYKS